MDLLILHPNYPAQFKHLCESLPDHGFKITFITQNISQSPPSNIKVLCLDNQYGKAYLDAHVSEELDKMQVRGKQYLAVMQHLKNRGYTPDLVIGHSGWGCALLLDEVWPHVKFIAYLEWIFASDAQLLAFEPSGPEQVMNSGSAAKLERRNHLTLSECRRADVVVTPTHWQRHQIPFDLRHKCIVIHEGVNLSQFRPRLSSQLSKKLITYGTRGFEPMRGFSYFIRELLQFLPKYPDIQVEIAGEDKVFYSSSPAPHGHDSWGLWAEWELSALGLENRVQFVKRLPASQYIAWLRQSNLHIYLTQPFVLSWSLIEALNTCQYVGSSCVAPVLEVSSCRSPLLFDHRRPGWLQNIWELICTPQPSLHPFSSNQLASRHCAHESLNRWSSLVRQLTRTKDLTLGPAIL